MLKRADIDRAGRIELELQLAGAPARVVGRQGEAWALVLEDPPRRGLLGQLAAALVAALGAPVHVVRRGRELVVWLAKR
jgi:hypothetical protein